MLANRFILYFSNVTLFKETVLNCSKMNVLLMFFPQVMQ